MHFLGFWESVAARRRFIDPESVRKLVLMNEKIHYALALPLALGEVLSAARRVAISDCNDDRKGHTCLNIFMGLPSYPTRSNSAAYTDSAERK